MALSLGVLISGTGTNLGAILDAIEAKRLNAEVKLVISNRQDAAGLLRAEAARVPHCVVSHREFADRAAFDARLVELLRSAGCEWVVLAGFMRIVTQTLLEAFPSRVINIHPSLLPAFPGIDAQSQALIKGVKVSGCTVHLVDAGVDTGPILAQAVVPVLSNDDRDTLSKRILAAEHALLVHVLGAVARGELVLVRKPDGTSHAALGPSCPQLLFDQAYDCRGTRS